MKDKLEKKELQKRQKCFCRSKELSYCIYVKNNERGILPTISYKG